MSARTVVTIVLTAVLLASWLGYVAGRQGASLATFDAGRREGIESVIRDMEGR